MEETTEIRDFNGKEVKVGSKVRYWDPSVIGGADIGEVCEITDFDMDSDDDGRPVVGYPDVRVRWPSSPDDPDIYPTSEWEHQQGGMVVVDDEPEPEWVHHLGKVEELVVVEP